MSGTLGWPGTWQSCFWLCSRLTLAQNCQLGRPRRARLEKEFPVSNFVFFWFCVPTSRSSGACRSQMESQQVPVSVHLLTHLGERLRQKERNERGDQTATPKVPLRSPTAGSGHAQESPRSWSPTSVHLGARPAPPGLPVELWLQQAPEPPGFLTGDICTESPLSHILLVQGAA